MIYHLSFLLVLLLSLNATLNGEKDENVQVTQAYLLRDRLTDLKKEFEIKLFPDRPHGIGPEVTTMTVDFFKRRLLQPHKN